MIDETRTVTGMAFLRFLAGSIELTAAFLMLRFGKIATALQINGLLGIVGPVVLVAVSLLGIAGLAHNVAPGKLIIITLGVVLILLGTKL